MKYSFLWIVGFVLITEKFSFSPASMSVNLVKKLETYFMLELKYA